MTEQRQQTIGWQGITIDVPEDWSLTGFGGDGRAGTLRVDAGSQPVAGSPLGLEVRWVEHKNEQNDEHLQARLKPLLKSVEKAAKREKVEVETWSGDVKGRKQDDRPAEIAFRWKSSSAASGRIWYCKTCGRTVIVQVYGQGGTKFLEQANSLLATIGCHGEEIGWRTWSLYGLETQAPAEYGLAGQQVMNIHLQLRYAKGRTEDSLIIEQWSLANVQLKGTYLDEWFEAKVGSSLAYVKIEKAEEDINGHSGLSLRGRRGGLLYWLSDGIRDLLRFRVPATYYEALVWECPDSNKAYLIQSFARKSERELVREIAGRTRCHVS